MSEGWILVMEVGFGYRYHDLWFETLIVRVEDICRGVGVRVHIRSREVKKRKSTSVSVQSLYCANTLSEVRPLVPPICVEWL